MLLNINHSCIFLFLLVSYHTLPRTTIPKSLRTTETGNAIQCDMVRQAYKKKVNSSVLQHSKIIDIQESMWDLLYSNGKPMTITVE